MFDNFGELAENREKLVNNRLTLSSSAVQEQNLNAAGSGQLPIVGYVADSKTLGGTVSGSS